MRSILNPAVAVLFSLAITAGPRWVSANDLLWDGVCAESRIGVSLPCLPPGLRPLLVPAGIDELPRSEDGQFTDGRGREVPRVARHEVAPNRDGTFRERGVGGVWKASNKMGRSDYGEFGLGLNASENDRHFMAGKVEFRTRQHLFMFRDNPVIQPRPHRATSQPFDNLTRGAMRIQKPGYQDIRAEDCDTWPVAHEGRFRSRRAAAITPSISGPDNLSAPVRCEPLVPPSARPPDRLRRPHT